MATVRSALQPKGLITDSGCEYGTVEKVNAALLPKLSHLVKTPFFRYVKIDLEKSCPYWKDDGMCMMRDCTVEVMDEGEVQQEASFMYRQQNLGDVTFPGSGKDVSFFKSCEFTNRDFCVIEDEATNGGAYVDLQDNPERFTGYTGESANRIWQAIYQENCFDLTAEYVSSSPALAISNSSKMHAMMPPALQTLTPTKKSKAEEDEVCLEKRVFYKLISGLHTSISIHICSEHLNKTTGEWGPNLNCFKYRVGQFPERIQNLYFDYAVLLRAIKKISPYLEDYDVCTGNEKEDLMVKNLLRDVVTTALSCPKTFDEKTMFIGPEALTLKEEFRLRFRNISKIMDCVSCQKCRLWGKTQVTGLGTALKILFSYDDRVFSNALTSTKPLLSRIELVALMNTFNRFAESIRDVERFRDMWDKEESMSSAASEPSSSSSNIHDADTTKQGAVKPKSKNRAKRKKFLDDFEVPEYWSIIATSSFLLTGFLIFYCTVSGQLRKQDEEIERIVAEQNEKSLKKRGSRGERDLANGHFKDRKKKFQLKKVERSLSSLADDEGGDDSVDTGSKHLKSKFLSPGGESGNAQEMDLSTDDEMDAFFRGNGTNANGFEHENGEYASGNSSDASGKEGRNQRVVGVRSRSISEKSRRNKRGSIGSELAEEIESKEAEGDLADDELTGVGSVDVSADESTRRENERRKGSGKSESEWEKIDTDPTVVQVSGRKDKDSVRRRG
ncbi:endoplasmic reticulum Oxidoreductin 1-domain-containing protein [Paraphysoderma sedebokerense]|nr:endoplasmic reticulum Oxidoreductin 1-domain-containing protein [Paraphysoderma sedebokerense]